VATGVSEPLAIEVSYMKFLVDTADVAEIWAKTGQSTL
jgi:hypothetical protein